MNILTHPMHIPWDPRNSQDIQSASKVFMGGHRFVQHVYSLYIEIRYVFEFVCEIYKLLLPAPLPLLPPDLLNLMQTISDQQSSIIHCTLFIVVQTYLSLWFKDVETCFIIWFWFTTENNIHTNKAIIHIVIISSI